MMQLEFKNGDIAWVRGIVHVVQTPDYESSVWRTVCQLHQDFHLYDPRDVYRTNKAPTCLWCIASRLCRRD